MVNINKPHRILLFVFLIFIRENYCFGQITYFEQHFDSAGPFTSATPNNSQFDQLASTSPHSSFSVEGSWLKLKKGVAEGGSGLVYFQRSTPLAPTPASLYFEAELTVNQIDGTFSQPAGYFYIGSGINSLTGSIPTNSSLTTRFGIHFTSSSTYTIRYVIPGGGFSESAPYALGQKVHVLAVINTTSAYLPYRDPTGGTSGIPNGSVDIWADQTRFVTAAASFSGSPPSEFGFRLINAPGEVAFDLLRIREVDGILPADWTALTAVATPEAVQISWTAATRFTSSHFEVERLDGTSRAITLGRTQPKGEIHSLQSYQFKDENPLPGLNYYRVRRVDPTATSRYSGIVVASFNGTLEPWIISPNPSSPERILVRYPGSETVTWGLLDPTGKPRKIQTKKGVGSHLEITPIETLNSGIYLLTSQSSSGKFTRRVIIP